MLTLIDADDSVRYSKDARTHARKKEHTLLDRNRAT